MSTTIIKRGGFNWGWGLALALALFIAYMVYFLTRALTVGPPTVERHAYEKGLRYDDQYARMQRTQADAAQLTVRRSGAKVVVTFPAGARDVSGTLLFLRPDAGAPDFEVAAAAGGVRIPVGRFKPGLWRLRATWQASAAAYFDEQELFISPEK